MKLQLNPSNPFNLDATLCCGQAFRWDKYGEWWYGVVGEKVFKVRQNGDELEFGNANLDFVRCYFGLHDNLAKILLDISKDQHVRAAVKEFKGLRILRQEPWECLISYICATYKNIAAIKHMLLDLSRRFGSQVQLDDLVFYTFPSAERLAKATVSELAECGLGYRSRYVSETARMICRGGLDSRVLREAKYEEAKRELLGFPGVGLKVADCVLLFSLKKLEAFPVDVWMRRVIVRHYAQHFPTEFIGKVSGERSLSKSEYERINFFGREYFGRYAGFAQEYLYHYERSQ